MRIQAVIFDLDGTLTEPFLDFDLIRREIGLTPDDGGILEAMDKMPHIERQFEIGKNQIAVNDVALYCATAIHCRR